MNRRCLMMTTGTATEVTGEPEMESGFSPMRSAGPNPQARSVQCLRRRTIETCPPYAAGTGLEGNALPAFGGVSMDFTRMDMVLEIRPEDFQIEVEPGVLGSAVNDALAEHDFFLPPLPQSADISTIGGMLANDAPTVFLEFHANHHIETEIETCSKVFAEHGAEHFETAIAMRWTHSGRLDETHRLRSTPKTGKTRRRDGDN